MNLLHCFSFDWFRKVNLSAFLIVTKPVLSDSVLDRVHAVAIIFLSLTGRPSFFSLVTSACYRLEHFLKRWRKWCQDTIPQQCLWEAVCSWPPSIWLDYTGWNLLILRDCVVYVMVTLLLYWPRHRFYMYMFYMWLKVGFHCWFPN